METVVGRCPRRTQLAESLFAALLWSCGSGYYSLRKALFKLLSGTTAARRSFALLASLSEVIRLHSRVPRLSLPDDPHCVRYAYSAPDRAFDRPVSHRKATRIPNRSIHPRGWA